MASVVDEISTESWSRDGTQPSIAATSIWPFLDVARGLGDPVEAGLAYVGLNEDEVRRPGARISHAQLMALLEISIAFCGHPERGLLAAEKLQPAHFGLLEFALRSQPTLREGLATLERHWPLVHDGCTLDVASEAEGVALTPRFAEGLPVHAVAVEFTMAALLKALSYATGVTLRPIAVHLGHTPPSDISHHTRVFGCPLVFDAERSSLLIRCDDLNLPLLWADAMASEALESSAQQVVNRIMRCDRWTTRVAQTVGRQLSCGHCSAETIASELGVTLRTLQRKLAREHTRVGTVIDRERARVADNYLLHTDLSIDEIAARLGYAGAPGLRRAIKRWTGRTPAEHRRALRGDND